MREQGNSADQSKLPALPRRFSRRAFLRGGGALAAGGAAVAAAYLLSRTGQDSSPLPAQGDAAPTDIRSSGSPDVQPQIESNENSGKDLSSFGSPDVRPQITFTFDEKILPKDRQAIDDGANLALDFFRKELGTYTANPINYVVKYDTREGISSESSGNTVIVTIGGKFGEEYPTVLKQRVVVGESFNILVREVTGRSSIGPWILEAGVLQVAGFKAIIDKGLMSYQEAEDFHLTRIRRAAKLPPITSMQDVVGTNLEAAANSISYLAVNFLVSQRGVKALGEYLLNLSGKPEMPWEDAFQKTFGKTFDQFTDEFETYRQTLNI